MVSSAFVKIGLVESMLVVSAIALLAAPARGQSERGKSAKQVNKATSVTVKDRKKASKESKPEVDAAAEQTADSKAAEVDASAEKPSAKSDASNDSAYKMQKTPGWMLGLGLSTTPDVYFENSIGLFGLGITATKGTAKVATELYSYKAKTEVSSLGTNFEYASISNNQQFYWKAGLSLGRSFVKSDVDMIINSESSKTSSTTTTDSPEAFAGFGVQTVPGLWAGVKYSWLRDQIKNENPAGGLGDEVGGSGSSPSRVEYSTQTVGLGYRGHLSQMGLEFSMTSKADELTTGWQMPLRFALNETMFLGTTIGFEDLKAFGTSNKSSTASYLTEIGRQGVANALSLQVEYSLAKSDSDSSVITDKTKQIGIQSMFGSAKGIRLGFLLGYALLESKTAGFPSTKYESGLFAFGVAKSQ